MNRLVRVCLIGSLALGIGLLASSVTRGDDDDDLPDIKEAQKVTDKLKKLTDAVADGKTKDLADLKKAVNDTTDLKHIMWAAYKPPAKGGFGANPKPDSKAGEGIERRLDLLSQKGITQGQLAKESDNLIRAAQVAQAMAEIAELNTPRMNMPKKPIADWTKFNNQQKEGAKELIDAVKANKPADVKTAATKLYGSCTSCHGVFR
jgi:cytochrome c556